MRLWDRCLKDKKFLLLFFFAIFFTVIIRANNLERYNTWWADDGGAQVAYVEIISSKYRLPLMSETYLAWHEPLYYVVTAVWAKFGSLLGFTGLNFLESLQIIIFICFFVGIYLLAKEITKIRRLSLFVAFVISLLFPLIKLSSYLNNELLLDTFVIYLVFFFLHYRLLEQHKTKYVFIWSIILGLALLTKLTAFIVLVAVILIWLLSVLFKKRLFYLKYIFICIILVAILNAPWLVYKQKTFGQIFSINLYEKRPMKSLLKSDAWIYIKALNKKVITYNPFWFSQPHSFLAIAFGDTFSDYYNLFNDVEKIAKLPENEKFIVGNGRPTTLSLWKYNLRANQIGVFISLTWFFGFTGFIFINLWRKKFSLYHLFLVTIFIGGWLALLYNNLRMHYLNAGVLKIHFIFFTYPILIILAYNFWWDLLKNKLFFGVIVVLPLIIYTIVIWSVIFIR